MTNNAEKDFLSLSVAEQKDFIFTPCHSKEYMDLWLRTVLGIYLAKKPLVPGNSSPLDFLWDCYSSALNGMKITIGSESMALQMTEEPSYDLVAIAGRGSQKSLTCGVLEYLLLIHDTPRDLFHMASIRQQAKVTYRYIKSFINKPHLNDTVNSSIASETTGIDDNVLQLGTGTMDSVNSFHGSVIQDEVDLTDPIVFQESSGMLSPTKDGRMPINVAISSRKFAFGNIQRILDNREKMGVTIHRWGVLENTQRCDDVRSGTKKTDIWVNEQDLHHLSTKDYGELEEGDYKDKFIKMQGYDGCVGCPIFSFCQSRLKEQDGDNQHLIPIDLTIKYFKREDIDFFKAQRLNQRPSRKGLIYPQFNHNIHMKNYNQMWEIFFGAPAVDKLNNPIAVTREMLIHAMRQENVERSVAVDFGFNNGHMLLIFIDGSDRIYVIDEITTEQKSDAEMAQIAWKAWGPYGIDLVYPDAASPGGIKEFEKAGFSVSHKVKKTSEETVAGLGTVRRLLQLPGSLETLICVSFDCPVFREQMSLYHYVIDSKTDEPTDRVKKDNDHGCDAFRYFAHTRFGATQSQLLTGHAGHDKPKNLTGMPTPNELASHAGLAINDNRAEHKKGNNGNEGGGNNSGGGFNFTFG